MIEEYEKCDICGENIGEPYDDFCGLVAFRDHLSGCYNTPGMSFDEVMFHMGCLAPTKDTQK